MASTIESETNENTSLDDQNQIPSDEQINTDESPTTTTPRTVGQTAIGAKLVKKLETLGNPSDQSILSSKNSSLAANNSKPNNATDSAAATSNESESRRNITKTASM
jgi:hypothetical protein